MVPMALDRGDPASGGAIIVPAGAPAIGAPRRVAAVAAETQLGGSSRRAAAAPLLGRHASVAAAARRRHQQHLPISRSARLGLHRRPWMTAGASAILGTFVVSIAGATSGWHRRRRAWSSPRTCRRGERLARADRWTRIRGFRSSRRARSAPRDPRASTSRGNAPEGCPTSGSAWSAGMTDLSCFNRAAAAPYRATSRSGCDRWVRSSPGSRRTCAAAHGPARSPAPPAGPESQRPQAPRACRGTPACRRTAGARSGRG